MKATCILLSLAFKCQPDFSPVLILTIIGALTHLIVPPLYCYHFIFLWGNRQQFLFIQSFGSFQMPGEKELELGLDANSSTSICRSRKKKPKCDSTSSPRLTQVSYLHPGTIYTGFQTVKSKNTWHVRVQIQQLEINQSYLCGTMEAFNVPNEAKSIVTFWEGEVGAAFLEYTMLFRCHVCCKCLVHLHR